MLCRESTMKRQRWRTRVEAERKILEDNFYIHVTIHIHVCLCHYIMGYINKSWGSVRTAWGSHLPVTRADLML